MSRDRVYQLTRRLGALVKFQSTSVYDTYQPSDPTDLEAFQSAAAERIEAAQKATVKKELDAFRAEPETPTSQPTPKPDGDENALWKTLSVSKPRATFDNLEESLDGTTAEEQLTSLREVLGECTRCDLCESRSNIVFGVGNPDARIMIVGEAPGFNEDKQGEPFVGKAGELLNKMIKAMGFEREEVYIANVLKCRPPQNRDPAPNEVVKCSPFLKKQVEVISPEVIIAMGKFASNTLTGNTGTLSSIRGHWHDFEGIPLMPTFHPAYLLRNESGKRDAWNDLQTVMRRLGIDP